MDSARPWRDMTPVGFSHSEISGSKPVCDSPELFAANYVLHRHLTPRHPSCALSSLTTNLCCQNPGRVPNLPRRVRLAKPGCTHARVGWFQPPSIIATRRLRSRPPWGPGPPHLADPAVDLADAVQGRDRSSSSELRSLDSIDARFHISQDTPSRRRHLLELSKNVGI